jgi:hypothetical protein
MAYILSMRTLVLLRFQVQVQIPILSLAIHVASNSRPLYALASPSVKKGRPGTELLLPPKFLA